MTPHPQPVQPDRPGNAAKRETAGRWMACAALTILCLALWSYGRRNYHFMAYSDGFTWLRTVPFPLGGVELSPGFPLYLKLASVFCDRFTLMLANLPVVLLMITALYLLAAACLRDRDDPAFGPACGIASVALYVLFHREMLLQIMHPYRDALSALFLLGSLALLVSADNESGPRAPAGRILLSGVLLGCAYAAREPSIFLAFPSVLFLLLPGGGAERPPRTLDSRRWRLFFYALGLGLVVAAVALHSMRASGNPWIPAYAARNHRLAPGMHLGALPVTVPGLWAYYTSSGRGAFLGLAAAGLGAAVLRRNRPLLLLILPCLVICTVFYCFYHRFVVRYFLHAELLLSLFFAYPLALLPQGVRRWRAARLQSWPWLALFSAGLALFAARGLRAVRPEKPLFQIRQARNLCSDLTALAGPTNRIFCPRPLCQIITYLKIASSEPAEESFARQTAGAPARDFFDGVDSSLERNHRVLFLEPPGAARGLEEPCPLLGNHYDVRFLGGLETAAYHLETLCGAGTLRLYEIQKRTRLEVRAEFAGKGDGVLLLSLPMDDLSAGGATIRLSLNGAPREEVLHRGGNFIPIKGLASPGNNTVLLSADAPLPGDLHAEFRPLDQGIDLDLSLSDDFLHAGICSPELLGDLARHYGRPLLSTSGSILLRPFQIGAEPLTAELFFRTRRRPQDERTCTVIVSAPGGGTARLDVLRDGLQSVAIPIPAAGVADDRLDLRVQPEAGDGKRPPLILIDRIQFRRASGPPPPR